MKKYFGLFVIGLLISSTGYGQLTPGKMALATTLSASSSGIGASYTLDQHVRINAGLDLSFQKNYTVFGIVGSLWFYRNIVSDLSGYWGGGFGFTSTSYNSTSSNSFYLNAVYGAEYWLSPMFSVNINAGADVNLSPDFGLAFVSAAGVSWWFK